MTRTLALTAVCLACHCTVVAQVPRWQRPVGARTYKETTVSFTPGGQRLNVIFYYEPMKQAAVTILKPDGSEVASAFMDLPHGFSPPTGVYHLRGDMSSQIVVFGRVGAKAAWCRVYDLRDGRLVNIFEWSGWSLSVLRLHGRFVLAARDYEHGSLTNLYLWSGSKFEKANERFPEFYNQEIEHQEKLIRSGILPSGIWLAEACEVAAQALLYSRRYVQAARDCQDALLAIDSRCCSALATAPSDVAAADRDKARKRVGDTIKRIKAAQTLGSTTF